MPAKIIVEAGASAGLEFAIEEEVFRIGSGAECKLRLQDGSVAAHMATVEYRDGVYRLYNRSSKPLKLGTQPAPAGRAAEWRPGQPLETGEGILLRLKVEGDPAPVRRGPVGMTAAEVASDAQEEPAQEKPASSGKAVQYAVIALCAVVLAVVLLKPFSRARPQPAEEVDVHQVVRDLQQVEATARWQESLGTILQDAHLAERRGQRRAAVRGYQRVVQLIRQRHGPNLGSASPAEQQAHAVALMRGRALAGGK